MQTFPVLTGFSGGNDKYEHLHSSSPAFFRRKKKKKKKSTSRLPLYHTFYAHTHTKATHERNAAHFATYTTTHTFISPSPSAPSHTPHTDSAGSQVTTPLTRLHAPSPHTLRNAGRMNNIARSAPWRGGAHVDNISSTNSCVAVAHTLIALLYRSQHCCRATLPYPTLPCLSSPPQHRAALRAARACAQSADVISISARIGVICDARGNARCYRLPRECCARDDDDRY